MKLILIVFLGFTVVMYSLISVLIWFGFEPNNLSQSVAYTISAIFTLIVLHIVINDND